jgi:hypothetical protein
MRRTTFAILGTLAIWGAGCGSSGTFANKPRPATPVDLTVYVNNARVSVSPGSVGAGQVIFIVTNQASTAQSVSVHPSDNPSQRLASTGPINPQATAQVTVDLGKPGDYTVTAGSGGGSDAAVATAPKIQPASVHIGKARASSSNVLLQP